jgi:serine O-acetyltransferase
MLVAFLRLPGFRAAVFYRYGHAAHRRGWRFIGSLMSRMIHWFCRADINTLAEIGEGLYMAHPDGIVVGELVRIGKRAYILHQVVLGGTTQKKRGDQCHPCVGDDVYFGAGAKIIGPVRIGDRVVIGANAVVTGDLPSDCTAVGIPARIIRQQGRRVPLLEQSGELADLLRQALERLAKCERRLDALAGPGGPVPSASETTP